MKRSVIALEQAPSASKKAVDVVGIALAIIGLSSITIENDILPPSNARWCMLGMALIIACMSVLKIGEKAGRPAITDFLAAGFSFCAGVFALWRINVDGGIGPDDAHLWPVLLAIAAILTLTWRLWGAPLAIAGLAAVLHAMIWEHGPSVPSAVPIDRIQDMTAALGFSLAEGVLGWPLENMLSTVLPFFLLGAILADQTFLGSSIAPTAESSSLATRSASVIHALARLLAPTMIIATLLMTNRPGIDLPIIITACLLPTSACAAWFWMMSRVERTAPDLSKASKVTWRDILLIGSTATILSAACAAGLSLVGAAILALGAAIAFGAVAIDGRLAPTTVLRSLARGGIGFAGLLVAIAMAGLILAVLDRSGVAIDLANILAGAAGEAALPLLAFSACVSIGLGAVMPALAAYLIVTTLIGPALRTVGITDLTIHLFVLFACVGAMMIKTGSISSTPGTISAGLATIGVGFAFASNPELLLVPEALVSVGRPDHVVTPLVLTWAVIRTGCMLYLLAMATEGFRHHRFGHAKTAFCITAALASTAGHPIVYGLGLLGGALVIASSRGLVEHQSSPT